MPSRITGKPCGCRRKCFSLFSDNEKEQIIDDFSGLGSKDVQDANIFGLVACTLVNRRCPRSRVKIRNFAYTFKVSIYVDSAK